MLGGGGVQRKIYEKYTSGLVGVKGHNKLGASFQTFEEVSDELYDVIGVGRWECDRVTTNSGKNKAMTSKLLTAVKN